MVKEFIKQLNSAQQLSDNIISFVEKIIEHFINSTDSFDNDLKYIKENWSYSQIIEKYDFSESYPMVEALLSYSSGITSFDLINLDYDLSESRKCTKPICYDFDNVSFENEDEADFILTFHFNFQRTWCAFRWQELNMNSIGYKALIFENGAGNEFYLTDLKNESESDFVEFQEYSIFENQENNDNLSLFEIYERTLS